MDTGRSGMVRRSALALALVAMVGAGALQVAACGNAQSFCANDFCGGGDAGDSSADGRVDAHPMDGTTDHVVTDTGHEHDSSNQDADIGPTCTSGAPPSMNGCITASSGVFVSMTGMDMAGYGTMSMPYASVTYALQHLTSTNTVYVCGGTYTDQITVGGAVSVYGGLTCAGGDWVYSASAVPVITAMNASFGVEIDAGSAAVDFEDIEVDGADAGAGGTTIAFWANSSTNVSLHRVKIVGATAGQGATGADGTASPNYTAASADAGADSSTNTGGGGGQNSCADGTTSQGGQGGGGGGAPSGGQSGSTAYTTPYPSFATGTGGTFIQCEASVGGISGSYGENGGAAGSPPANPGTWSTSGSAWVPSVAGPGTNGGPGQGGGGGGGNTGGGGGGGGAGGCGGAKGQGGTSGGASFALLSINSTVTLDHCTILGGTGGAGGNGGNGQDGQTPGAPGNGTGGTGVAGCAGGTGGFGQGGGGGGGGAGGPSVAIAYVGTEPTDPSGKSTITAGTTTPTAASGGNAGDGGTVSNPDNGTAGDPGSTTAPVATLMLTTS
jgi:hypothetical protein